MSNEENFKRFFTEVKSCQPAAVPKLCIEHLECYVELTRSEQKEFAETLYRWAEKKEAQKPVLFSYAKFTYAFSLYYREYYDESLPLLVAVQDLFTEQNDLHGAALCSVIYGSIYRTFGNVDLALKNFWEGYDKLKNAVLYQHYFLACSVNMAGTYLDMKMYEEAIPLFEESLALAEKNNRFYWTVYSLHGLGKVYLAQDNFPEAKECFEKAMEVSQQRNHRLSICNSLSELGNYYFKLGDYTNAESHHRQSMELREQYQFIGGAITNCTRLAEIFIKEGKPDDGLAVLNKGLKLAEQVKLKPKLYQIHFLLSEIYHQKNEMERSLYHYKIYHDLHEQVAQEDTARQVKSVRLIFEAEQTKKENIIIKKQKEEIERKNIELQETIDELTLARIGKKARALTLIFAVVSFIIEDTILHFTLEAVSTNNYFISLFVKMGIIFSLGPVNKAIEKYLLKRIIKKRKFEVVT